MQFPAHLNHSHLPTPVIPMTNYFAHLTEQRVWLKRDDMTGLELSGNKVRKLDFLLQEALDKGASTVITCGGVQSNHCRTTAFYAKQLGLKVRLVLRGVPPERPTGNLLLNIIAGAEITYVSATDYQQVDEIMRELAQSSPETCYIIPEGGSNETGAWGYVRAFDEIRQQSRQSGITWDTIVVATGSGGTHAGLLIGSLLQNSPTKIFSVNVCDDASFFKEKINRILHNFSRKYELPLTWTHDDIHIIDGFVGAGYGAVSHKETAVIKALARSEGIVLDPVYGAKAFRGFQEHLERGGIPGRNILFIHTGGIFGVFPYGEEIALEKEEENP